MPNNPTLKLICGFQMNLWYNQDFENNNIEIVTRLLNIIIFQIQQSQIEAILELLVGYLLLECKFYYI